MPEPSLVHSLEKSKKLARIITSLFLREYLDAAVKDALEEQEEMEAAGKGNAGLVQLLIPCNIEKFTPSIFQELLSNPEFISPTLYEVKLGEETAGDKPIYGRKNEAFLGRVISGRNHNGFLVYDSTLEILVDLINRGGKTLMNPMIRAMYVQDLKKEAGYDVSWKERPLAEI